MHCFRPLNEEQKTVPSKTSVTHLLLRIEIVDCIMDSIVLILVILQMLSAGHSNDPTFSKATWKR